MAETLLIVFVIFILLGTPIGIALGIGTLAAALVFPVLNPIIIPTRFVGLLSDSFLILAAPLFILAGNVAARGGVARAIIDLATVLVGRFRGGLAYVNILDSMIFGGISGSAVADTAALGSVLIPSMKRAGYSGAFAAAVTQTSAVIGPIIPPSIPMIVFAVLSETSVGKLFVAGIVPGVLTGIALMVMAYVISRRRGYPREASASARRVLHTGWRAMPALVAPVIIVGGVLGGVFTATEAGTVAAAYCFLIGKFVLRELTWRMCWQALVKAAIGTSTVLVILGSATIFAWIVADLQVSRHMAEIMFAISQEPWAFLLMLNICLLIVGLFLEPLPAMIIMVPIFFPIAADLGIDPIHFGLIVVVNLMIGLCTPPVGVLIYMSAALAETKPEHVIRESLPFIAVLVLVLLLVTYVPALTLALANLAYPT